MIKYRTGSDTDIETIQVVKEAECFVWVETSGGARREGKNTSWGVFHDTWQAAKDYLMQREERKVEGLRRQLELAKSKLGNVKGLKNPAS